MRALYRYSLQGQLIDLDRPLPGGFREVSPISGEADLLISYAGPRDLAELPSARPDAWHDRALLIPEHEAHAASVRLLERVGPHGPEFILRFGARDPAECHIFDGLRQVEIFWAFADAPQAPPYFPDDLVSLFGPLIGVIARLKGRISLHAGAIRVGDRALLLSGPSSSGKSTLLTTFALAGYPVIADDQMLPSCHDGAWFVERGNERPRLHRESIDHFGFGQEKLSPVFSIGDKQYVDAVVDPASANLSAPASIAAMVLLQPRSSRSDSALSITRLPPATALHELLGTLYPSFLPVDVEARPALFAMLAGFVRTVPMFTIDRPNAMARLEETREALLRTVM